MTKEQQIIDQDVAALEAAYEFVDCDKEHSSQEIRAYAGRVCDGAQQALIALRALLAGDQCPDPACSPTRCIAAEKNDCYQTGDYKCSKPQPPKVMRSPPSWLVQVYDAAKLNDAALCEEALLIVIEAIQADALASANGAGELLELPAKCRWAEIYQPIRKKKEDGSWDAPAWRAAIVDERGEERRSSYICVKADGETFAEAITAARAKIEGAL